MAAVRSTQDLGAAVRAARRARGWSQHELARRAGVGRQWLVAVERGHDRAEVGMIVAVLQELGLQLETTYRPPDRPVDARRTWLTAADAADAIRDELERDDEVFALRLLARCVADMRTLEDPADLRLFLQPPPSTGDQRWDTLLAATIGRECRLRGLAAPQWTSPPPLRSWWFPVPDPLLRARTMQRTPADFASRGIWLDGRALETR